MKVGESAARRQKGKVGVRRVRPLFRSLVSVCVCVETMDGDQRAVTGKVLTPESPIKIKRD